MKGSRIYIVVIIILALALTYLYRSLTALENRISLLESPEEVKQEEVDLIGLMGYNQRFLDKLYFSGKNDNWELAGFYHHELEEVLEEIVEGKVLKNGLNLSDLSERMLAPTLEEIKSDIEAKDKESFLRNYQTLVNSCNACHTVTKYPFIQILVPEESSIKNQKY